MLVKCSLYLYLVISGIHQYISLLSYLWYCFSEHTDVVYSSIPLQHIIVNSVGVPKSQSIVIF